jgi:diguanylate cyclase (GGDEF)-like protein
MLNGQQIKQTARASARLLTHPLLAAFLPAILLGGLWFGPQGAMAVAAVALPVVMLATQGARDGATSRRDRVTGLASEEALLEEIATDLARADRGGRPGCLLVLQVEDLPQLASRHGQQAADHALQAIARRLHETVRDNDSLARISGGRLAVLVARPRRMTTEIALSLAERLQREMTRAVPWEDGQLHLSVTIGLALDNQLDAPCPRRLLEAASIAHMEAARAAGGAIRVYSDSMRKSVSQRRDLAAELRRAFDNGQIEPWYQPQLCTETGRITGFEALARWQHPERGVIPPRDFLDATETAGLMARLGETMLFHALAALRAWDRAGVVVDTVGVNFSDTELRDPRLVDRVRWELDRFDILPERLCVEVLENVVADDKNDVITRNIEALATMGCRIDLDDFGTGHASITNIRRFAVTRLKIDRSFVNGVERDEDQRKLVSAILTMAEQLGLETIAEGVETPDGHTVLAQLGCDYVQGFGIARPMPFEDTIPWMKAHISGVHMLLPIGSRPAG